MDKKVIRFFRRSIISVILICIAVFFSLMVFMAHKRSEERRVGKECG